MREKFWWPGVYCDVTDYIQACGDCDRAGYLLTYHKKRRATVARNFLNQRREPFEMSKTGRRFSLLRWNT